MCCGKLLRKWFNCTVRKHSLQKKNCAGGEQFKLCRFLRNYPDYQICSWECNQNCCDRIRSDYLLVSWRQLLFLTAMFQNILAEKVTQPLRCGNENWHSLTSVLKKCYCKNDSQQELYSIFIPSKHLIFPRVPSTVIGLMDSQDQLPPGSRKKSMPLKWNKKGMQLMCMNFQIKIMALQKRTQNCSQISWNSTVWSCDSVP